MLKKSIHTLFLGLAATLMLTFGSAEAFAQNTVGFVTDSVTSFQVIQGTQQGGQNSLQRVKQTYWIFDTSRGVFYFYPMEYYQWGLQPFVGTYRVQGNKVIVEATYNISFSTGGTSSQVIGEIDFSGSRPVANLKWITGAAQGASVGGINFGSSSNSAYQFTASLKRSW
ncbi:MAG: hypothetical protein ACKVZH_15110 [Blastocatellia bacterium]